MRKARMKKNMDKNCAFSTKKKGARWAVTRQWRKIVYIVDLLAIFHMKLS